MEKYIDKDIAAYETTIVHSTILALGTILGSIVLIDYGYGWFALIAGAGSLAFIFCGWDGVKKWMAQRALVVAYKLQTRNLYVYSNGESEAQEDDETVVLRVEFALEMLHRVGNPHEVTVWSVMFRDGYAFGYKTGKDGKHAKTIRLPRDGFTVRETREEYWAFCEQFQKEREQEELMERRGNQNADEWVAKHWFGQEIQN